MDRDFMERVIAALEAIQMSQEEILFWLSADRRYIRQMLNDRLSPEDYQEVYADEYPRVVQDFRSQRGVGPSRPPRCMCTSRTKDPALAPERPHKSGLPCKLCEPPPVREKYTYPTPGGARGPICPVMDRMPPSDMQFSGSRKRMGL
jgi:hypothetical protein